MAAPAEVSLERRGRTSVVRLVIHEGRKRQVRRMLEAVGHPVLALHRVRVGPIELGRLEEGEVRALDRSEREALAAAVR
jgi:23S rRNA pseudouridine2605 synthase